jgi:signal peptidase I
MRQQQRYFWCLLGLCAASLLLPFRLLQVNGHSMEPTLRNGERYLLDRFYYRLGGLRVGDLVVVQHNGEQLVKRVKGLPGDVLQFHRGGITNVTATTGTRRAPVLGRAEEAVEPGRLYLIGDNFNHSEDSRSWRIGQVPESEVIGIVRRFTLGRTFPEPAPPPAGRRVGWRATPGE